MSSTLIAALVGLVGAVITSLLAGYVGYRRLRTEVLAQTRKDYMQRQIAACEDLWRRLLPLSEYRNSKSIVHEFTNPIMASPRRAREFCEDVTAAFFTPTGLYISREVRYRLFVLRAIIDKEFVRGRDDLDTLVPISRAALKRYRHNRGALFRAIRSEVGAIDLRVVQEGLLPEASQKDHQGD